MFTVIIKVLLTRTGLTIKLNSKYHILFTFFILLCSRHIHAGDQVNYDISLAGNRIGQINIAVNLTLPNQRIAIDGNIDGSPLQLFDSNFASNSETNLSGGKLVSRFYSIKSIFNQAMKKQCFHLLILIIPNSLIQHKHCYG